MKFAIETLLFVACLSGARGQPANGSCETAQVVQSSSASTPILTATTAGGGVPSFPCGAGNDSPAVYYQFIGDGARVRISTCADVTDFNTQILVEPGGKTCGGTNPFCRPLSTSLDLDCDPTGKAVFVEFFTVPDQLYLFAVQSRDSGSTGNFGLSFVEYIRPENDLCEDSSLIQPRGDTEPVVVGTTVNATRGAFPCGAGNGSPAVFYQFLGTGTQVRLSTCADATDFNTGILVETGGETCGGSNPFCRPPTTALDIDCDPSGKAVFVEVTTEANRLYLVAVQSRDVEGRGEFGLSLQAPGAGNTSPPTTPPPVTLPTPLPATSTTPPPATITPPTMPMMPPSAPTAATQPSAPTAETLPTAATSDPPTAGQPGNNGSCETAQVVQPSTASTPILTATTAGGGVPNFPCGTGNDSPAVFYQFIGNGARVRISTCSDATDFNTEILVENTGKTCGGTNPFCRPLSTSLDLDCDPTSKAVFVEFFTVLDRLYLFAVQSRDSGSTGNFGLSFVEYIRPENDLCEDSSLIEPRGDADPVVFGTTVNATRGTFPCGAGNDSPAVFYQFLGTGAQVRLSTCSNATDFNTEILVEAGGKTCGGSNPFCRPPTTTLDIDCDPSGKAVFVEVTTEANRLYLVAVQSRDGDGRGEFGLSLQAPGSGSTSPPTGPPPPTVASSTETASPTQEPTISLTVEITSRAFVNKASITMYASVITWILIWSTN